MRLVRLMAQEDANELIFDARIASDVLYVVSPNFEQLELPLTKLLEFRPGTSVAQWSTFEVDELGGLFIHWPDLDLHLGWPELKQIDDPEYVRPLSKGLLADAKQLGSAFRDLRKERGMSQLELVDRIEEGELSTKTLSRFERGDQFPSATTISKIASALEMSPSSLLNELADRVESIQLPTNRKSA